MDKKNVAQFLVESLENAGVKHCYGIVGDSLNHVTHAMQSSKIKWVHMRHEEAGAFAAGAESFISGQLTACAGSCGPGSLHFINGLFESQKNRAPVILIASQIATANIGTDFPQEVDFLSIYKGWTVFCEQIRSPDQAHHIITMAIQTAINEKGVAVIVLPVDISKAAIDPPSKVTSFASNQAISPSTSELKDIAQRLNKGKRIGIYAGIGAKDAHDELIALAKKLNAPIAHTTRAKDFIEPNNPYNMGLAGILGTKAAPQMLQECDTILLAGNDFAWGSFLYPPTASVIQIDINAAHLGRRCPIALGVAGDIKTTITALLPLIDTKTDRTFLDQCLGYRKETVAALRKAEEQAPDSIIRPQYLTKLLNQHADDDAIFVGDGGSPMVWVARHIDVNGKRRTLSSYRHGTMANAMPQALGLQKAYPSRQVISLSGDGGLAMLLGDLLTTKQEALPIKVVVLNNASLDFVEIEQKLEGLPVHYTDLNNPNFSELAKIVGMLGIRVEKPAQLEPAIKQFLAYPGSALLDVVVDPKEVGL